MVDDMDELEIESELLKEEPDIWELADIEKKISCKMDEDDLIKKGFGLAFELIGGKSLESLKEEYSMASLVYYLRKIKTLYPDYYKNAMTIIKKEESSNSTPRNLIKNDIKGFPILTPKRFYSYFAIKSEEVDKLIEDLFFNDKDIILLAFGFKKTEMLTLNEVANYFNLTLDELKKKLDSIIRDFKNLIAKRREVEKSKEVEIKKEVPMVEKDKYATLKSRVYKDSDLCRMINREFIIIDQALALMSEEDREFIAVTFNFSKGNNTLLDCSLFLNYTFIIFFNHLNELIHTLKIKCDYVTKYNSRLVREYNMLSLHDDLRNNFSIEEIEKALSYLEGRSKIIIDNIYFSNTSLGIRDTRKHDSLVIRKELELNRLSTSNFSLRIEKEQALWDLLTLLREIKRIERLKKYARRPIFWQMLKNELETYASLEEKIVFLYRVAQMIPGLINKKEVTDMLYISDKLYDFNVDKIYKSTNIRVRF